MVHSSEDWVEVWYVVKSRGRKPAVFSDDPTIYVSYHERTVHGGWSLTKRMPADEFDQKVDAGEIIIAENDEQYHQERKQADVGPSLTSLRVRFSQQTRDELTQIHQNAEEITYGD